MSIHGGSIRPSIHIYSDGTSQRTKVVGPDGREVTGVKAIKIEGDATNTYIEIELTIRGVLVDVDGRLKHFIVHCPHCNEVVATHGCMDS